MLIEPGLKLGDLLALLVRRFLRHPLDLCVVTMLQHRLRHGDRAFMVLDHLQRPGSIGIGVVGGHHLLMHVLHALHVVLLGHLAVLHASAALLSEGRRGEQSGCSRDDGDHFHL